MRTLRDVLVRLAVSFGGTLLGGLIGLGLTRGLGAGVWAAAVGVAVGLFLLGVLLGELRQQRQQDHDARVLAFLATNRESYGLAMSKAGLGGQGTIYIRLRRLEENGLLVSREEDLPERDAMRGFVPRRLYRLTPFGQAALFAACARGSLVLPGGVRIYAGVGAAEPPPVNYAGPRGQA